MPSGRQGLQAPTNFWAAEGLQNTEAERTGSQDLALFTPRTLQRIAPETNRCISLPASDALECSVSFLPNGPIRSVVHCSCYRSSTDPRYKCATSVHLPLLLLYSTEDLSCMGLCTCQERWDLFPVALCYLDSSCYLHSIPGLPQLTAGWTHAGAPDLTVSRVIFEMVWLAGGMHCDFDSVHLLEFSLTSMLCFLHLILLSWLQKLQGSRSGSGGRAFMQTLPLPFIPIQGDPWGMEGFCYCTVLNGGRQRGRMTWWPRLFSWTQETPFYVHLDKLVDRLVPNYFPCV